MQSNRYKIVVDSVAFKDLLKIKKGNMALAQRIANQINILSLEPLAGKPLKGDKKGCYSLRCGDWRIIYEVYHSRTMIHIIRVGHRRDVYR